MNKNKAGWAKINGRYYDVLVDSGGYYISQFSGKAKYYQFEDISSSYFYI